MHAICAFANFSWNIECTTIHVGVFRITLGLGIEISKDIFFFYFSNVFRISLQTLWFNYQVNDFLSLAVEIWNGNILSKY